MSANLRSHSFCHCAWNRVHAPGHALQDSVWLGPPPPHHAPHAPSHPLKHPKLLPAYGTWRSPLPLHGMLSTGSSPWSTPSDLLGLSSNIGLSGWPSLTQPKQLRPPLSLFSIPLPSYSSSEHSLPLKLSLIHLLIHLFVTLSPSASQNEREYAVPLPASVTVGSLVPKTVRGREYSRLKMH